MNFYSYFYYVCLSAIILFSGCKNQSSNKQLTDIVDLFGDEAVAFGLTYDKKGNLIKFGNTVIRYPKNKIEVDTLKNILGYGNYSNIKFEMSEGKVIRSEARYKEKIGKEWYEVNKKVTYTYEKEKIVINSKIYRVADNELIHSRRETRELDKEGKLTKTFVVDTDEGIHTVTYKYKSGFTCMSNLNLQAYIYFTYGVDDVLAYLLNLYDLPQVNILPTEAVIEFSDNEKQLYTSNYCMDGDQLTRMEIMKDYEILATRLNFYYK